MNLVRSEFRKIRTTNAWWLYGLGALAMTALALLINCLQTHVLLDNGGVAEGAQRDTETLAANIYTSGQFFGLLFVMIIGILSVTNEFQHQTATTTFLATPHRTAVMVAKLITAAGFGIGLWIITTALDLATGVIFLNAEGVDHHLGDSGVTKAILLNLLAYVIWAIFGVGVGVLIRSQIGATVTSVVAYLIGTAAAAVVFQLLANWLHKDWIMKWSVIVPSIASNVMVTAGKIDELPPRWVAVAILVGYAVVTGVAGTALLRRRDVS